MKAKILIIDDENEIGFLLSKIFSTNGFNAKFECSINTGIETFKEFKPDVLFLDIHFPDTNGLDHIGLFKSLNKNVKIIIISAYDAPSDKKRAFTEGADKFVCKPFNLDKVKSVLEEALVN